MDELETALLVVTGVAVIGLTVAVLGLLRRVTDLRLLLSGHSEAPRSQLRMVAGRELPAGAVDGDALLVFATAGCDSCTALLGELDHVRGGTVVVVPADGDAAELRPLVAEGVPLLDDGEARRLVDDLGIDTTPFVLAQRDGIILGHAYGESAASALHLEELWATLGVRPLEEVPS